MRVLWLTLLVAAASAFEVGKEYVYKYKGTLLEELQFIQQKGTLIVQ